MERTDNKNLNKIKIQNIYMNTQLLLSGVKHCYRLNYLSGTGSRGLPPFHPELGPRAACDPAHRSTLGLNR